LARAVADQVRLALGCKVDSPTEAIELGDEALLWMDLSQAAAHFGVKPPPSRRDVKSGAKKRKQVDIERERLMAQKVAHG